MGGLDAIHMAFSIRAITEPVCDACGHIGRESISGFRILWIDEYGQIGASRDMGKTPTPIIPPNTHERAIACGQRDALVLTERYLERGTFAPADFTPTPNTVEGDFYLNTTNHELL